MNMRSWKDELYTSLKQDQRMEKRLRNSRESTDGDDGRGNETRGLEKEILDNLNETIGRFDNEKNGDGDGNVDEGTGEDTFSEDSIQCTTPSSKVNGKDTSNQETFNSSWDSGVGIDVGTGNGWVRIHTGIESSLVYLTVDTTTKDICRDMLLGDELAIYVQYGGETGRRMSPDERPLELQDEFLKQLGFEETTRRARLGVDPELRHLIGFHVGPVGPTPDLFGHSRSGNVLILKGLVFPQWKKRALAVIGSRLFLYPGCPESRPEWIELNSGAVCYAPSRLGKLVLRVTGYPRISQHQLEDSPEQFNDDGESLSSQSSHHPDARHLYLGFHHPWDRDLWRGWLKQAIHTTNGPKKLDLSRTGLWRIPESTLAFSGAEEIHLGGNMLSKTQSNLIILKRFHRLRALQLERNELKAIPWEILELNKLTSLDLSDNKVQEVTGEIHRLVNLQELVLDRNGIKELPPEIELLKELRSISLAGNKLTSLPSFLKMRALTLDVLTKNETVKLKDEKNNHNNLHKVNLRNNQLKGNIILGNYGNLTHLDVSENSIEKLDVSALQELQSARCARNSLTELTLCGRNLVSLIAGNNKLKRLTIQPVPTNLEHLDVSYNCLDALPEWISDLPGLRALFASHNDLTALPDRLLSQPSRLEVLHLPHNRLQALPPPRKPLNIVHLTLQGNALTALPITFFQNTERMKVLNLSNNRLSELPYTEEAAKNRTSPSLEKLYLTGNCLTDAALDALGKLSALRVLHLAYNVLDTLPESCIASWPDLEELVLSGNRLQYLPDNVANLQHLRVLRVHSNRLLTCPTFNKTRSLMVLDLAHNQLDRVNLATLVPPQLQFLDISCNSRLHVDPRQFQVYRSQRPVSLIDVSGQNRPSLPSHPLQQEVVSAEKGPEQPWRLGFSETAGMREKLYISQIRMPSFCNTEGLFGIFDGGTNQEAPSALQEMIPRLLLEERTIRETSKEYLKYTLLASHRELREKGQKYGVDATLIHITRLSTPQTFSRAPKKYSLRISSCGETKAVLCRAAGPLLLAPSKKPPPTHQLGNASMFPLVTPDPSTEEVHLEDDDEFIIIANKKLWEVLTIQEAVREARAEASPVLAAKRLQDLAQSYGAEDNVSVIVVRLTGSPSGDLDQLMRELRHAVTKSRPQSEVNCACSCCCPPAAHKPPGACCCHANDGFYLNGVLKNIVNRGSSRPGSGRYFKNPGNPESSSPPFRDDRSSPSGQSDQTTDSTFKTRGTSGRVWMGSAASRAASKSRQNIIVHENTCRKEEVGSERSAALSEEQFRCWEYMLEQNTHMLFDKELDTISRIPLRRGQSKSTPQLANLPFLSKRFGSARSFHPPLPRAPMMRFGSGRRFLNGGPNAAYFGSLQRLMPYNLEYDFAVIQERRMDSLEQDASRMQQYWGVATTEL
ncbi:protein phosphatase PHLPP-like protein [Fopius arisanus]|uniref:Protein phosphatase PHLPP-like protein n=1 Tax=Fopius arisanus TaxID=64838 RepID=A0A9R1T486_9HYME|nr:PREDICTED: protein phosphatase PHLPP-like protein [Fopius arisanus]